MTTRQPIPPRAPIPITPKARAIVRHTLRRWRWGVLLGLRLMVHDQMDTTWIGASGIHVVDLEAMGLAQELPTPVPMALGIERAGRPAMADAIRELAPWLPADYVRWHMHKARRIGWFWSRMFEMEDRVLHVYLAPYGARPGGGAWDIPEGTWWLDPRYLMWAREHYGRPVYGLAMALIAEHGPEIATVDLEAWLGYNVSQVYRIMRILRDDGHIEINNSGAKGIRIYNIKTLDLMIRR